MNRRQFLVTLSASAVVLVACDQLPLDPDDLPGFTIPSVSELDLGDARLVWDLQGNLYSVSASEHRVARLDGQLNEIWSFGESDDPEGALNYPTDIAHHKDGTVYVFERGNHRITVLDEDGKFVQHLTGDDGLTGVRHGVLHKNGQLYAVESQRHRISVFDASGQLQFSFGEAGVDEAHQLNLPRAIAVSPDGDLHVVDGGNSQVQVFSAEGTWKRSYGSYGPDPQHMFAPRSITIDPLGNSYVVDGVRGAIQVFDTRGEHVTTLGDLSFDGRKAYPGDVRITPDGLFYVHVYAPVMES